MCSEVCPFCGKSFKRLKSHLPHCKANAQTPAPGHHVDQTTSWAQQVVDVSEAKGTTPKFKSSTEASPSSPSSLSSSVKKKRQKLSEQIRLSNTTPPFSSSSSSSSSLPPSVSKPKKMSLRAQIEAAKASSQPPEGTKPLEELSSGSTLVSRKVTTPSTNVTTDQASRSDANLTDVPKTKATKTKRAKQAPPTITSDSPYKELPVTDRLWVDVVKTSEDSSMLENNLRSKVLIQDAKSILGRAKTGKTKKKDWTATTEEPVRKTRLDSGWMHSAGKTADSPTKEAVSEHQAEMKSLTTTSSKSRQASLIPAERNVPSQVKLFVPDSPAPPPAVVGRHTTELLTLSPSAVKFSSPRILPVAPQGAEPSRSSEQLRLEGRNQDAAATQRHVGQVKLRELPDWLLSRTPTHPKHVVEMVQRGWQWYYRRYIDVKKGSVGGLGMLLAGYCVLSYTWSYPHLKLERWRKYH